MVIAREQVRRVARILYPDMWDNNRIEAIASTIEFLYGAAAGVENNVLASDNNNNHQVAQVVTALAEAMKRQRANVGIVAKALDVSPYTVRTWLEGKYKPTRENSEKILCFVKGLGGAESIQSTE
jgi:hypothetical protein